MKTFLNSGCDCFLFWLCYVLFSADDLHAFPFEDAIYPGLHYKLTS